MSPEVCAISIHKTIQIQGICGLESQSFLLVKHAIQMMGNPFDCNSVSMPRCMGKPGALVNSMLDFRVNIVSQTHQHFNSRSMLPIFRMSLVTCICSKRLNNSWSGIGFAIRHSNTVQELLDQTQLDCLDGSDTILFCHSNIDAKEVVGFVLGVLFQLEIKLLELKSFENLLHFLFIRPKEQDIIP